MHEPLHHIASACLWSAGSHVIIPKAQPESELLWQVPGFCFEQAGFEAGPALRCPWHATELARGCVGGCCSHQGNISHLPRQKHTKKWVTKHKYHCRTPTRCLRGKLTWGELRQLSIAKQDYLEMRPITVPKPHSILNYARVLDPSSTHQSQQGGHRGLGSALHIL